VISIVDHFCGKKKFSEKWYNGFGVPERTLFLLNNGIEMYMEKAKNN